jgi:hypothetical protein
MISRNLSMFGAKNEVGVPSRQVEPVAEVVDATEIR